MSRLLVLLITAGLFGCSSDGEERHEYLDSYSVKALEIPPKLTQIENRNELEIPEPSEKALQLLKQRSDVEGSVAPLFTGLTLKSEQGMHWLEIEESAEQLWPVLQDFFAHEGIKIYRNEPLLGFMETEWVREYQGDGDDGFFTNLFKALSADVLDKFRIRVERVPGKKLSKVFVSHRGMEVVVVEEGKSWQQRAPEPMLEREMLYRLVLFTGLRSNQADEIFASYKPYQARIRSIDEQASEYEIVGQKDFVWSRILHALDRMGVVIKEQNQQSGQIQFVVADVPKELAAEKDELSESSWLMQLLKADDAEHSDQDGKVALKIDLQASGNATRMRLSHGDGAAISAGLAEQFKVSLVKLLR